MDTFGFGTILAYAAKINDLRKANPEAFKAVLTQVSTVMADVKKAMADDKLSFVEVLQITADACIGVEKALRVAITIASK